MKKKILGLLQYLFFLGLGLFLLWLTLRHSDWSVILADLSAARYIFLLPAVLMLILSHYIRALRWRIMLEPLGCNPSRTNTFLAVLVGYWANLAVPRLGEVLKCTILARYEKLPAHNLVGTIVAERAVDVLSLVVVLLITLLTQYPVIGGFAAEVFGNLLERKEGSLEKNLWILGSVLVVVIAVIWLCRKLWNLPLVQGIRNLLEGIGQGLMSIRHIRRKKTFLAQTALIWLLYLLSTWMGFFAMPGMSGYGLGGALSALTFGSFGMIIPSPGGIGSFQYAIQQVMLLYGVSAEKGLSLGMLIWVAQTGIFIVSGTLAFLLLPALNREGKMTGTRGDVPPATENRST